MKSEFKKLGFKYIRTSDKVEFAYAFNENFNEKSFDIAYYFTDYYVMKHKDNIEKIAELIKKLFENGDKLFYAEIMQTYSKFNDIILAILKPEVAKFFQKIKIVTKEKDLSTSKYKKQIKVFNFAPISPFLSVEYYTFGLYLKIKRSDLNNNLNLNYDLTYAEINEEIVRFQCNCLSQNHNNNLKINFIKLLMHKFDKFKIDFNNSKIQIYDFLSKNDSLLIDFSNFDYNSFDEFIVDIFNNLTNCKNLAINFDHSIFKDLESGNFELLNEIKRNFANLFKFLLDYLNFKKI